MLKDHIRDIRDGLRAGHFTNEASVSQGIVLRILHAFSWPTYEPLIVFPQYPLNGRRVDFALCHPPGKPLVFIEVKQVGQTDMGERQLFEYAFYKGVPMAILTDGREWHFFLPGEKGEPGERRVYKLDLVERDIGEIVGRLERYLKYEAVCSGAAVEAARADYKDVAREREINATLPQAWAKLIEEGDELLLELVGDRVESLCGYKPDPDTVAAFLRSRVVLGAPGFPPPPPTQPPAPPINQPRKDKGAVIPEVTKSIGLSLEGRFYPARNAREVLTQVFTKLADRDPNFLDRFANLPKHGRTRRYLARTSTREDLYPGRPDLERGFSYELKQGWWLGINLSKNSIDRIIKMACEVARLRYGSDLIVNLGV
jgi:hypothetical protein